MRALLLARRGGTLLRAQRQPVILPLTASALAYTTGAAAPDLRTANGSVLAMSALGQAATSGQVPLLTRVVMAASGQTPGTTGTAVLGIRAALQLTADSLAASAGAAPIRMLQRLTATGMSYASGVAALGLTLGTRTYDDFTARSLDTTKWQVTMPTEGTGGAVNFTTTSMIDLVTSNVGNYKGSGSVFLTEKITPSAATADSDVIVSFVIPADNTGTFHIWARQPTVGDGLKGYDVFADTGNGDLAAYRSPDGTQLYRSATNVYATNGGTAWKMRLLTKTVGTNQTRLAGKLWPAGNAEPSAWAFDVTDTISGYSTGYTSVQASPGGSASSYTWKVDSLSIANPQSSS
jgi:hypothetical protein